MRVDTYEALTALLTDFIAKDHLRDEDEFWLDRHVKSHNPELPVCDVATAVMPSNYEIHTIIRRNENRGVSDRAAREAESTLVWGQIRDCPSMSKYMCLYPPNGDFTGWLDDVLRAAKLMYQRSGGTWWPNVLYIPPENWDFDGFPDNAEYHEIMIRTAVEMMGSKCAFLTHTSPLAGTIWRNQCTDEGVTTIRTTGWVPRQVGRSLLIEWE